MSNTITITMRLTDGRSFPIPITLPDGVSDSSISDIKTRLANDESTIQALQNNLNQATSTAQQLEAQLTALQGSIDKTHVPIGTVLPYSSNNIPAGYFLCNGTTFSQTAYPDLYNALGTNTLPDMRGMFLRGLDTTGNIDNFGSTRSILSFEEGSRVCIGDLYNGNMSVFTGVANNQATRAKMGYDTSVNTSETFATAPNGGAGGTQFAGVNNGEPLGIARPKNIAVNYIIKAYATQSGNDGTVVSTGNSNSTVILNGYSGNVLIQSFFVPYDSNQDNVLRVNFPQAFSSTTGLTITCSLGLEDVSGSTTHTVSATSPLNTIATQQVTTTSFSLGMGDINQTSNSGVYVTAIGPA